MRDWSLFLNQACKLVGAGPTPEDWDAAAHLLLTKEEMDLVLWARKAHPVPGWDLVDYALTYFNDEIPF